MTRYGVAIRMPDAWWKYKQLIEQWKCLVAEVDQMMTSHGCRLEEATVTTGYNAAQKLIYYHFVVESCPPLTSRL